MRLLFDANLGPTLVAHLRTPFPGSRHVRDIGLAAGSDAEIWAYMLKPRARLSCRKIQTFASGASWRAFHRRSLMPRSGATQEALDILAEVDGHLLADVRAMIHWATRAAAPPTGMGRLNFALMAIALIGCESLGYLTGEPKEATTDCNERDERSLIIAFITEYFPKNNRFKRIPKILGDAVRHELVHGFGHRTSTAPFELGLFVSDDTAANWEKRPGKGRPILAINSVALARSVLSAFEALKAKVGDAPALAARIVANAREPFPTQSGVIAQWQNQVAAAASTVNGREHG